MPEYLPTDLRAVENKEPEAKGSLFGRIVFFFILVLIAGVLWNAYMLTTPPVNFKENTLINIPSGYSLQSIGKLLRNKSIIRSPLYFSLLVAHEGKEKSIASGMYLFKDPISVFDVAHRLSLGMHGIEMKKITIPEGTTLKEMAVIISTAVPSFVADDFLRETSGIEGYLFPDTYFFFSTATSGPIVLALKDNFTKKTHDFLQETILLNKDWKSIITMASIIEGEAVTHEDRKIVSQILWTRITRGMRLQVDAPFMYTSDKGSLELTTKDLQNDSPYNTYRYAGLPPTPIGSPGLDGIDAALHPATTTYLYYLSDKSGVMHYAKTFDEHKQNKARFLR